MENPQNDNATGCQVHTGFFVLHACNRPIAAQCSECGKSVCERHFTRETAKNGGTEFIVCVECYTRQDMLKKRNRYANENLNQQSSRHDYDYWYFHERHRFFNSSLYRPFDDDEYSNFEREAQRDDFDDDSKVGNLFDS